MRLVKHIVLIVSVLSLASCSKDLDFNQLENYSFKPVLTSAMVYFNADIASFTAADGASTLTQIHKKADFRVFENTFVKENIKKLDFNFEVGNTFDKEFILQISLLDDANNTIHIFNEQQILASSGLISFTEIIDIETATAITNFTTIAITVSLKDASQPLNVLEAGVIQFKSSITAYIATNF